MNNLHDHTTVLNEQLAAEAFSRQSVVFDKIYSNDTIIQYKRQRVRSHVERYLPAASSILELNSGTGEDAIYFAGKGHYVHATDIAAGMQEKLKEKVQHAALSDKVSTEICSFTDLQKLQYKGPYNLVFSNFAGLNCTDKLNEVLKELPALVKPGGLVTLVILPKFCLWETTLMLRGKFKTATRRFFSSKGANSHVEGTYFKCWYYNPSYVIRRMQNSFELISLEGLCTLVPPSYMEGFAEKHPKLYEFLVRKENRLKDRWPWKFLGDYYIVTMRKK
ncbi:MAG: class I SAM-dependent methyltransferase [Chitinophagaceae bacterium]